MSSFGFGGSNFHVVLEESPTTRPEPAWDGSVEIAALGAETPQGLLAELEKIPTDWPAFARFAEVSRSSFGADAPCRLRRRRACWATVDPLGVMSPSASRSGLAVLTLRRKVVLRCKV